MKASWRRPALKKESKKEVPLCSIKNMELVAEVLKEKKPLCFSLQLHIPFQTGTIPCSMRAAHGAPRKLSAA